MSLSLIINPLYTKKGSGCFCILKDGDEHVCDVEEWAFRSCAVFIFQGLTIQSDWWSSENIDRLVAYLPDMRCQSCYCPAEVYLLVSSGKGQSSLLGVLRTHPNIKEVDHFTNKAHGPNTVHLFRISAAKDFK